MLRCFDPINELDGSVWLPHWRVQLVALVMCFGQAADQASAAQTSDAAPTRPNIVFILADDLGINDLACYGRTEHTTPALDRLAHEGLRFANAYAAQSVCSPTRAAIMTGKTPGRLHLTTFLTGRPDAASQLLLHPKINLQLPLTEQTLAERLKPLGYATTCVGKWHLGDKGFLPTDQGFDSYHPGKANTKPNDSEGGKGEYDLTNAAEKFIEAHKDGPFFLYLNHNCPHIPLAAKPELIERHATAFNPTYAAMIETLDDCVGRVVAQIDRLGLAEQTVIIFTSDNGGLHVLESPLSPATHNTPYRAGKGFCYEGGLRAPLIVRWPKHTPADKVIATPVISTDWTPTLLELAGAAPMSDSDGVSLAGLIQHETPLNARVLCWHMPHYTNQGGRPSGAIRDGKWKLIENYEDGGCELFDLEADPGELHEASAGHPELVARLRGALEKWRREIGAQSNAANAEFELAAWKPLYYDIDASQAPAARTFAEAAAPLQAWRLAMNAAISNKATATAPGKSPDDKATHEASPPPRARGAIILRASEAQTHGTKLRYEDAPHKDTLGFWTDKNDWVSWNFDAPRAGAYDVYLLQGCGKGSGGAEIEIAVGEQKITTKIVETGHFQRFEPRFAGVLRVDSPGVHSLSVHALSKPGGAVGDVRRVTLIAIP